MNPFRQKLNRIFPTISLPNKPDRRYTVAVDLDGTLTVDAKFINSDHIADPRPGAREAVEQLVDLGCMIIIWTVRGNTGRVKEWLREHGIPFDFVNENPNQPPDSSGKVIADVYLDDRGVDATQPWDSIIDIIKQRIDKKNIYK